MSARDRRDQRNEAPASALTDEQRAFARGKWSAAEGRERVPPRTFYTPEMRAAWERGHTYETNLRRGLRPLDTARRLP